MLPKEIAPRGRRYLQSLSLAVTLVSCSSLCDNTDKTRIAITQIHENLWQTPAKITYLAECGGEVERGLIVLRFDNRMEQTELPLSLQLSRAGRLIRTDTIVVRLAEHVGKWQSHSIALHEATAPLPYLLRFRYTGLYQLSVTPLPGRGAHGIVAVGLLHSPYSIDQR